MTLAYTFTVYTPTFNRAHTLHRVYEGLQAQTFHDFEWLIIDDGSTDGTDALVRLWQSQAEFPIRYIWKENGGKHTADDLAAKEAHGFIVAAIGSDDSCAPQALAHINDYWNSIPVSMQPAYAGVVVLAAHVGGGLVGPPFPRGLMDSNQLEMVYRHRIGGDCWICVRRDVLRQFPYPQVEGRATHFNEKTLYFRMARHYTLRYVNDPLLLVYMGSGSLSRPTGTRRQVNARIAATFAPHYLLVLNEQMDYARIAPRDFFLAAVHYVRYSIYLSTSPIRQVRALNTWQARLLWLAALPLGALSYAADRWWPSSRRGTIYAKEAAQPGPMRATDRL